MVRSRPNMTLNGRRVRFADVPEGCVLNSSSAGKILQTLSHFLTRIGSKKLIGVENVVVPAVANLRT
jgi:hypothetical protein